MKFYYNDVLIRTSKTHHYKYAIICRNNCIMCSATKDGCEKEKQKYINEQLERLGNCRRAITAIENGKDRFEIKDGRRTFYDKPRYTIEHYKDSVEECKRSIEHIKTMWEIVEIEEKG